MILAEAIQDFRYGTYALWAGIALVLILMLFLTVNFLKRRMEANFKESGSGSGGGFSLSEFRRMHKEGKLTDEEFEKAKAMLIGNMKKAEAAPGSRPGPKKL